MNIYAYRIKTTAGDASGTVMAQSEDSARNRLAEQYAGQLRDEDDNPFNNDVESIQLEELNQ